MVVSLKGCEDEALGDFENAPRRRTAESNQENIDDSQRHRGEGRPDMVDLEPLTVHETRVGISPEVEKAVSESGVISSAAKGNPNSDFWKETSGSNAKKTMKIATHRFTPDKRALAQHQSLLRIISRLVEPSFLSPPGRDRGAKHVLGNSDSNIPSEAQRSLSPTPDSEQALANRFDSRPARIPQCKL